jgi:hypothetical protein
VDYFDKEQGWHNEPSTSLYMENVMTFPDVESERIFDEEKWPVIFRSPWREGVWAPPLPTALIRILHDAEELFGPRDKSFTFLGIEFLFEGEGGPNLWWDQDNAIIQLQKNVFYDFDTACMHCAHECVHLLSPIKTENATYLEEGAATYFEEYVRKQIGFERKSPLLPKYIKALDNVSILLDSRKDVVKAIREKTVKISDITKDQLLSYCPKLDKTVADFLCQKFYE